MLTGWCPVDENNVQECIDVIQDAVTMGDSATTALHAMYGLQCNLPQEVVFVIDKLLQPDPCKRANIHELLMTPWLQQPQQQPSTMQQQPSTTPINDACQGNCTHKRCNWCFNLLHAKECSSTKQVEGHSWWPWCMWLLMLVVVTVWAVSGPNSNSNYPQTMLPLVVCLCL